MSKPVFRQIAPTPLDVDDADLARLNDRLNVPTMVRNRPAEEGAPSAKTPPVQTTRLDKLTIELPTYLSDDLKIEALRRKSTVRHLIMQALAKDGFTVQPQDMVPDKRKTGAKRSNA